MILTFTDWFISFLKSFQCPSTRFTQQFSASFSICKLMIVRTLNNACICGRRTSGKCFFYYWLIFWACFVICCTWICVASMSIAQNLSKFWKFTFQPSVMSWWILQWVFVLKTIFFLNGKTFLIKSIHWIFTFVSDQWKYSLYINIIHLSNKCPTDMDTYKD